MAQKRNAKATALKRAGGDSAGLELEQFYRLALQTAGVDDAMLASAGRTVGEALNAERRTQQGDDVPDWDARLRAATLVFEVRGVRSPRGVGGGSAAGSGGVTLNIVMPDWVASPPTIAQGPAPTVIDVPSAPGDDDRSVT